MTTYIKNTTSSEVTNGRGFSLMHTRNWLEAHDQRQPTPAEMLELSASIALASGGVYGAKEVLVKYVRWFFSEKENNGRKFITPTAEQKPESMLHGLLGDTTPMSDEAYLGPTPAPESTETPEHTEKKGRRAA